MRAAVSLWLLAASFLPLSPGAASAQLVADSLYASPAALLRSVLPPCARPDSNVVSLPGGEAPQMRRFVARMDSVLLLGKGRVSIVQIGGSHVQADLHTEVFRQRLDSLNGGLRPPRGFLFPYAVARTNNPPGYRVRHGGSWGSSRCSARRTRHSPPLGMGGITVFTSDADAWIGFDTDPDTTGRWLHDRLRVVGRSARGCLSPVVSLGDTLVPPAVADSLGYEFVLPRPVSRFELRLVSGGRCGADTFFVDGIVPMGGDDGIVFHSIGVNGATVRSYLRCALFERQMALLRPDLVIFAIGVNDASGPGFSPEAFCESYDRLIESFRRASPGCALLFVSNNDTKRRQGRRRRVVNANGPVARDAFEAMAEKWQGGLWDLFEVMGGLGSMGRWQEAGLARRDNVHFTRAGYKVVGALFYDAFMHFYLDQEATDDNLL